MERENPPPYSSGAPPPGFAPHTSEPPLQPMKPPYSSYPQHDPHQQTTQVIITPGPITVFGPHSQHLVCPSCHAQISTTVKTEPNTKTHLFALLLCLFGCWPCCCIPYCMDSCQSQNHSCPHCGAFLGSYQN